MVLLVSETMLEERTVGSKIWFYATYELICFCFMDVGKRYVTSDLKTKNFVTIAQKPAWYDEYTHSPCPLSSQWAEGWHGWTRWMLFTQRVCKKNWVALGIGYFYSNDKQVYSLCSEKILPSFQVAFCNTKRVPRESRGNELSRLCICSTIGKMSMSLRDKEKSVSH